MDDFKREQAKCLGPGGMKCPCCGPKPGKERKQLRRRARRVTAQQVAESIKHTLTTDNMLELKPKDRM